ncbi:MAG: hypothetical protein NW208_11730 [Bryobacter sp.]|nr:hypothetical protein [Bryobacter sp.]
MATLTIRKLDDKLKERLRVRAAEKGRSMEAEARSILEGALESSPAQTGGDLVRSLRKHFEKSGFLDMELPPRKELPRDVSDLFE